MSTVDELPAASRFRILGRVQGVGFRPFVVRLASLLKVTGWVKNTPEGVMIHVEGPRDAVAAFGDRLRREPPPAAEIHDIGRHDVVPEGHRHFSIQESELSERGPAILAVIAPDLAACGACLDEFDSSADRRFGFALSGCTDCGPRFSIQTSAPFDRERTTMLDFAVCAECAREYSDPADRRFHAQNVSCPHCGPRIWLESEESSDLDPRPQSGFDFSHPRNDLAVIARAALLLPLGQDPCRQGNWRVPPVLRCDRARSRAAAAQAKRRRSQAIRRAFRGSGFACRSRRDRRGSRRVLAECGRADCIARAT